MPATFTAACGNTATCGTQSTAAPTTSGRPRCTRRPSCATTPSTTRYNGVEFTARKRLANKWMMNGSLVWNHQQHFEPDANIDYLDPTNHAPIDLINGYESGGMTLSNSAGATGTTNTNGRNAPVIGKLSGLYQFPWGINFAANFNGHSSYPYNPYILTGNRTGGQAGVAIFLNPSNALRYPALFQTDIHVDKTLAFGVEPAHLAQLRLVQHDEQQRRADAGRAAQPVDGRQHHDDAGAARGALRPEGELLGPSSVSIVGPASRTSLGAGLFFFDRGCMTPGYRGTFVAFWPRRSLAAAAAPPAPRSAADAAAMSQAEPQAPPKWKGDATVKGKVVDETGKPVAGAKVSLRARET